MALAKGASMAGTATCSGEGGMIPPERDLSTKWYYQVIQSRYGFNPHHLMLADAIEFFIGQGCKVGLGGHLMGQKVTEQVAEMRSLPAGIDQRSPARHPDWLGPGRPVAEDPGDPRGDRLPGPDPAQARRRARLRRRADGGQVRAGHHLPRRRRGRHRRRPAPRHRGDRHPADGGDPGGAARARGRRAGRRDRPRRRGRHPQRRRHRQVHRARRQGGRDRPLGADGAQLQQGDPRRHRLHGLRSACPAGECYHCHTGRCPVGITTQDPELRKRLIVERGGRAGLQLPPHAHARGAADRARVREDEHPLARARGPRRADRRGGRDGEGAADRHRLHPGRQRGALAGADRAAARAPPGEPDRLVRVESAASGQRHGEALA